MIMESYFRFLNTLAVTIPLCLYLQCPLFTLMKNSLSIDSEWKRTFLRVKDYRCSSVARLHPYPLSQSKLWNEHRNVHFTEMGMKWTSRRTFHGNGLGSAISRMHFTCYTYGVVQYVKWGRKWTDLCLRVSYLPAAGSKPSWRTRDTHRNHSRIDTERRLPHSGDVNSTSILFSVKYSLFTRRKPCSPLRTARFSQCEQNIVSSHWNNRPAS